MIISRVLVVISLALWCQSNAELKREGKSFSFSSEDFDDPRYKGLEIFESGPIRRKSNDLDDGIVSNQSNEDYADQSSGKSNACYVKTIPSGCKLVSDCDVRCSIAMFGQKGQMEVAFPCRKSPHLVVNIAVSLLKKRKVYSLAVNSAKGSVIKELGYNIGNMKSKILFSATMDTLASGKVVFKLYSTIKGNMQGLWSNKVKTKFIEVRRNALTNKCASKKKQQPVTGACAKLKLPSICAITSDCMHIYCELKFAGQKVSFGFSLNICAKPMTLSVGAEITALHILWKKTLKSGVTIPIPGYAFQAPGVNGGVLISVVLKNKRGRLQLKIKLLVGAKVGWVKIYPIKFTLLSLRLPIKLRGCGKKSLLDKSKTKKATNYTRKVASHKLPRKKKQAKPTSTPTSSPSTIDSSPTNSPSTFASTPTNVPTAIDSTPTEQPSTIDSAPTKQASSNASTPTEPANSPNKQARPTEEEYYPSLED